MSLYDPYRKARTACAIIQHTRQVAPESKTVTIMAEVADELRQAFERADAENQEAREALRLIQWYLGKEDAPQPSMLHNQPKDLAHGVAMLVNKMRQIERVNQINRERS